MRKKNLTLFFTIKEFEKVHLYKDVGLVPYYLGKEYNFNVDIVYSNEKKKELPENFRNISLVELQHYKVWNIIRKIDKFNFFENISFYKYLLKKAKNIDCLMIFHLALDKFFLVLLYKILNKKGKVYLKMDMSISGIRRLNNENISFFRKIQKIFLKKLVKRIDLLSIEAEEAYNEIVKNGLVRERINNKIICIPNGFDEEYLIENKIKINTFEKKENIMITVGRIGTEQKNNEMLLKALNNIDLKEWEIYLIGPYTDNFKNVYDEFLKLNPDKKEKVFLIGNVEDKNLLYDYYNRARVFLLTSRLEGFANVFPEALRFGNYIITTDVGGAKDITDNGRIGTITEIENIIQFKNEILKTINNEINLEEKYESSLKLSKEKFLWNEIVKNKKFKKIFEKI